jgi:hypothetical protein
MTETVYTQAKAPITTEQKLTGSFFAVLYLAVPGKTGCLEYRTFTEAQDAAYSADRLPYERHDARHSLRSVHAKTRSNADDPWSARFPESRARIIAYPAQQATWNVEQQRMEYDGQPITIHTT